MPARRRQLINITPQVQDALDESGIREGLALVNAMHISASVFINDDESGLHQDYENWLEKLAPEKPHSQYRHNVGEDNADAHLKRTIHHPLMQIGVCRIKRKVGLLFRIVDHVMDFKIVGVTGDRCSECKWYR